MVKRTDQEWVKGMLSSMQVPAEIRECWVCTVLRSSLKVFSYLVEEAENSIWAQRLRLVRVNVWEQKRLWSEYVWYCSLDSDRV